MTKKGYYAAPLFSHMELQYNEFLVGKIREAYPELGLYVPQENGEINDKNAYADSILIAKQDTDRLLESNIMIAILDRQQGATNEKKLAALQEVAESQFPYVNLYTIGLIKTNGVVVNNTDDLITQIGHYLNK